MSQTHSGNALGEINREEHDGLLDAKRVSLVSSATIYVSVTLTSAGTVTLLGIPTISASMLPFSYWQNISLVSGYQFFGFTTVGNNPTTANFQLLRQTLLTGEVLYGAGTVSYINTWSVASMPSISWS